MPTAIIPASVVLPATFNGPADGEPRTAASVLDPLQTLADGILYATTKEGTDIAALQTEVDAVEAVTILPDFKKVEMEGSLFFSFYNRPLAIHSVIGASGVCWQSRDGGQTWSPGTIVGSNLWEGAVSDTGITVMATSTHLVAVLTDSLALSSPAMQDARGGAAGTITAPATVAYDPTSDLFFWFARTTTPGFVLSTSPGVDGLTWTQRAAGGFTGYVDKTLRSVVSDANGRLVLALGGSTSTGMFFSDNGGVSWSSAGDLEHGFSTAMLSLTATPSGDFLLSVNPGSGGSAEVWLSTDGGETWTKKSTLTGTSIQFIAAHGSGWIGVAYLPVVSKYAIVVSIDEGTTWVVMPGYYTTPTALHLTCGRIYLAIADAIYASQFLAVPGMATTS